MVASFPFSPLTVLIRPTHVGTFAFWRGNCLSYMDTSLSGVIAVGL